MLYISLWGVLYLINLTFILVQLQNEGFLPPLTGSSSEVKTKEVKEEETPTEEKVFNVINNIQL